MKRVLFVSGFRRANDGSMGGQVVATLQLMSTPVFDGGPLTTIDSTMKSLPPPPVWVRAVYAANRFLKFLYHVTVGRCRILFVFSQFSGAGFLEKGTMCIVGKMLRMRVTIAFRSDFIFNPWAAWFVRAVCRSCDCIMVQSTELANRLHEFYGISHEKIETVESWIDTDVFCPVEHPDLPKITLLFLAWYERVKGLYVVADATWQLHQQGTPVRALFYGQGSQSEGIREHVRSLDPDGNILQVHGWISAEDKLKVLQQADIMVLPTEHREGFPNVLLEAMACGIPVVTSPAGGIPAILRDGVNGLFVPPRDASALAEAVQWMIDNPDKRREMGRTNRRQVEAIHDLQKQWPKVRRIVLGE
jgi:glycosyltransferase involved in cell wall biosynthesis